MPSSRPVHHADHGFRNPDGITRPGFGAFLRWQWARWLGARAEHRPERIAVMRPAPIDVAAEPDAIAVTWIGHVTQLIQIGGLNVLTDPLFSYRASPVQWAGPKRRVPLPATLAELPRIDVVLLSHNHYDHLDAGSIRALAAQPGGPPRFVVPLGLGAWLAAAGLPEPVELDWWDKLKVGAVELTFVPAQHWSKRRLWGDENASLWGGFVIAHAGYRLWYAGDTAYSPRLAEIGLRAGPIDFAMIPVGAYEPRWFMRNQHVDPFEALRLFCDVRARQGMGVHWGTFALTDEAIDAPLDVVPQARVAAGVAAEDFTLWAIGETRRLR
ncbi:MBL fold metallo-hydrolase [Jeongeupia sp. USM3]|uniref:MBL fold metallo-hydrolase n=1 Tax=Jeongeupia sp. USM3 TaxID=1906741 RepID=UPI000A4033E2|nr:MBL fold metallo-hydrolase [Jeongeupia sp. USM3]